MFHAEKYSKIFQKILDSNRVKGYISPYIYIAMAFLKNISYEVAALAANLVNFEKTYPEFLNERVPVFIDERDDHYIQLFDWYDEDHFVKIPKSY